MNGLRDLEVERIALLVGGRGRRGCALADGTEGNGKGAWEEDRGGREPGKERWD